MKPQTKFYDRDKEVVARRVMQHWKEHPEEFATHVLGNEPYDQQLRICKAVARSLAGVGPTRICVKSGHKTGKDLDNCSVVPTPDGWKRHGDLKVGDRVYDEQGNPCNVTAIIPQKSRPMMRVTFEDGTYLDADELHEWVVHTRESRKRTYKPPVTLETRQLAENLTVPNGVDSKGNSRRITNFTIDLPTPLQFPERELPIDPYLLGVWLGDGTTACSGVTTPDKEIESAFSENGYELSLLEQRPGCRMLYVGKRDGVAFRTQLRTLGVLGNKHVPEDYLWASAEQRLALLQGLMDTDGTADGRGKGFVEFTNTNERLSRAVLHLARSLGIKARIHERRATLNGEDYGPIWDVSWNSPMQVFRLPRQLAKLRTTREKKANAHKRLAIVDIQPLPGVRDAQCIEVDSPSHLYLAGESFVPSHNSNTAAFLSLWFPLVVPGGKVVLTAEAGHQIRDIIWPEVRNLYNKAIERGFKLDNGRLSPSPEYGWKLGPGQGGIVSVTPEKPVGMAGLSAPKQLFIIDEASEYDRAIFEAVRGNMATGGIILALGNPTWPGGWFYEAFMEPDDGGDGIWEPLTISSLDTPNMILGETVVPGLAERAWLLTEIYDSLKIRLDPNISYHDLKHFVENTDDPFINVRVLGRFPSQSSTTIFPTNLLHSAQVRWRNTDWDGDLQFGVDPSWLGPDRAVIAPRRGKKIKPLIEHRGLNGPALAREVLKAVAAERRGSEIATIIIEMMGVGVSCYDQLQEVAVENGIEVIGVNTSIPADDEERYANLRAQLHFDFKDWLEAGGAIPPDKELETEAAAPRCVPDKKNRKLIEKKDEIIKRLGHSPDKLDACILSTFRWSDSGPVDDAEMQEAMLAHMQAHMNVFDKFIDDTGEGHDYRGFIM